MSQTVWVTGVAGFTGRHLVAFLRQLPEPPRIVGLGLGAVDGVELDAHFPLDVTDPGQIEAAIAQERPDIVFHLAAVMPPCDDALLWHVNVGGTNNLLRTLAKAGCQQTRILLVGSAAEYQMREDGLLSEDDPVAGETHYGQSKSAQIEWARQIAGLFGLSLVVARPFNLIGPGLPERWVAAMLCAQFADPGTATITVGNTASERDFVDVRDCVQAYWELALKGTPGEAYNVCSNHPTGIGELIDILQALTDGRHSVEVDRSRFRSVDLDRVYGTNHKIREAIGWQPQISLKQSLLDMLDEHRDGE